MTSNPFNLSSRLLTGNRDPKGEADSDKDAQSEKKSDADRRDVRCLIAWARRRYV